MPYLTRRIQQLADDLKSGRVHVSSASAQSLLSELSKVEFDEDGTPNLKTVSAPLRSMARAYDLVLRTFNRDQGSANNFQAEAVSAAEATRLTRELFDTLQALFISVTGQTPKQFIKGHNEFASAIKKLGVALRASPRKAARAQTAFSAGFKDLSAFYERAGGRLFSAAKELLGMKLVQGGQQSFTPSSLASARSMLLYADTILVPDPVYRWLEIEHEHERFRMPRMLEDMFYLLQLKPLVDADLPYPPLLVFPSFEKRLEQFDRVTQDAQELLVLRFFSHYMDAQFDDVTEVFDFAQSRPEVFASHVMRNKLLVPPGGTGNEDWNTSIEMIKKSYADLRSDRFHAQLGALNDAALVAMTIMERLGPQYHLHENAGELRASPLMSLHVHWHYFNLLANANCTPLVEEKVISPEAIEAAKAMAAPDCRFLGNVPVDVLVELRARGENETFRKKLNDSLSELGASTESTINAAAGRVGRAVRRLLVEHNNELDKIVEKYERTYAREAVVAWITLAASFIPLFPALIPAAALGIVAAYGGTKFQEKLEKHRLGRTLTGILAASARDESSR